MVPLEDSFENVYKYLISGIECKDLKDNIICLIDWKYMKDPRWEMLNEAIKFHINKIKLYVIDYVKSFSHCIDRYHCRYSINPTFNNSDMDKIIRYQDYPYHDLYNAEVDALIFTNFLNDYNNNLSTNNINNIIIYLINKITLYEFANGHILNNFEYMSLLIKDFNMSKSLAKNALNNEKEISKVNGNYPNDKTITEEFNDLYHNQSKYFGNDKLYPYIVGRYGELLFDEKLCNEYGEENVVWVSRYVGDGLGYDFLVNDNNYCTGIEVKSTINYNKFNNHEFGITKNEFEKYSKFKNKIDNFKFAHLLINPNKICDEKIYGTKDSEFIRKLYNQNNMKG